MTWLIGWLKIMGQALWVDLGTYADANGKENFYGFAYKMDLKSLVWYSPEQFEDNGYEIPKTMEELIELSDQMVADGNTPWCIGIESGNATGWTATDWMEDLMLRTASPAKYDQWVSNELPFNSPEVINAMEVFENFRETTIMLRVVHLQLRQLHLVMRRKVYLHLHQVV